MIILATAIILSLNSSNIVEKAKEAKTASDMANAKNVVILAKGEWELMTSAERANYDNFAEYAESKLLSAGYALSGNGGVNVSSNGVVSTIYVDEDGREAIIPEGFTVSTKAGEKTITGGLVIIDNKGNEFVWVPVDDFTKFERTSTYNGKITPTGGDEPATTVCKNYSLDVRECLDTTILSVSNDITGEWAEYLEMRESVKENKGFYIGRYETGTSIERLEEKDNGTTDVLVKKNKFVYNYVGWGASTIDINGDVMDWQSGYNHGKGAVELSRNMYKGSTSVVSTLCYAVQWDSALQFIATNPEHKDYPLDSTGKGYYSHDEDWNEINLEEVQLTGSSDEYAVNNIYDMAGNVGEWSMLNLDSKYDLQYRTVRGGSFLGSGTNDEASSYLGSVLPNLPSVDFGFRICLYLK